MPAAGWLAPCGCGCAVTSAGRGRVSQPPHNLAAGGLARRLKQGLLVAQHLLRRGSIAAHTTRDSLAKHAVQLFAWYGQWPARPRALPSAAASPPLQPLACPPCPLTDTASFQRTPLGVWYLSRQLAQSRLSTAWISYTVPRLEGGRNAGPQDRCRSRSAAMHNARCMPAYEAWVSYSCSSVLMQSAQKGSKQPVPCTAYCMRAPCAEPPHAAASSQLCAPVGQRRQGSLHEVHVAGAPLALVPRLLHKSHLKRRVRQAAIF